MSQLPEMVQVLLDPKIYPERPQHVEMVQTQMSFVFLTDEHVYKVKKPVDLGYLNYTTLEKRHGFCEKEVELNRRLCPEAYLGVVAITRGRGSYSINGEGKTVEYAVKMRRLPQDAMLDVLLAKNRVTPGMIGGVAERVAEFHRRAEVISSFGDVDTLTTNTEENFSQTEGYIGRTISRERFEHIRDWTRGFIKSHASLFRQRIAEGRIRDCHGDLHAAHICFTDGICIYDCIEFNDRFRYCDVAAEVSFLAMDLDRYGRGDLSQHFVDAYVERSGDRELLRLLGYYKCYFACVRGKVNNFQLDDPHISGGEKERIQGVARRYFELAEGYIR
jgi:hypothetical protein